MDHAGTRPTPVVTGTSPHGQGHETAWSQIVADALGVHPDDVEVLHSDTAVAPFGRDTYGSRSLAVGGVSVHLAAGKVVDKAKKLAAHLLEAAEDDLAFDAGRFSVKGTEQGVTIQEVALAAPRGRWPTTPSRRPPTCRISSSTRPSPRRRRTRWASRGSGSPARSGPRPRCWAP